MKKFLFLLCFTVNSFATDLNVIVKDFPDKKGTLHVAVCDKQGFGTENYEKDCLKTFKQNLNNDTEIKFMFTNTPEKDLVIQGFIDKNSNNKLDTNFLGIPKETYFFVREFSGFPDFDEVKTKVQGDTQTIILKAIK